MRVALLLLEDRTGEPLFLQVKQAAPSVYERHLEPSTYDNHGARVINGKRLIQSATDMYVGWTSFEGRDYYVRQFRDMKIIPDSEQLGPVLADFATACGSVLAKAHARTGDPAAIAAYLGKGHAVPGRDGRLRGPLRRPHAGRPRRAGRSHRGRSRVRRCGVGLQ